MTNKISSKITNEISQTISYIPGLVGLASIDLTKNATVLNKDNFDKAILLDEVGSSTNISIAIIVTENVRSEVIVSEIESSIYSFAEKNDISISKIIVYIRGVK